jgi:probable HAF family extracellular repeat protein
MRTKLVTRGGLMALCTALLAIPLAALAQTLPSRVSHYDVHPLTLNGEGCRVSAIENGVAVGYCGASPRRAFAWTEANGVMDLGTLGGTTSEAWGTRGARVVGSSTISGDLEPHAFAWSLDTGLVDLGSFGGAWAYGNSVSGRVVVGTAEKDGQPRGFRWRPATGMVALPLLPGGSESSAYAVDGGLIAGYSTTPAAEPFRSRRPVVWRTDGTLIDPLGTPIEACGDFVCGNGEATAVRDGMVVGYRSDATQRVRAFAWTEAGGLVDLGLVPGAIESFALDTDGGAAVGQLSGNLTPRAFVWDEANGMRAITPETISAVATSITKGRVAGWWYSGETNGMRVFRWTERRGAVDVTPSDMVGSRPMGIDGQGRIAIVYEDEDPTHARSVVLVPKDPAD